MAQTFVTVAPESAGSRLDLFLARHFNSDAQLDGLSRAEIQRVISEGRVTINGHRAKASARLKRDDTIIFEKLPPKVSFLRPEQIPIDVLYEDEQCIVINKAAGIMVHPATGTLSGTLVNALLHHCPDLDGIGGERRPGIVHRLDKDTSGVMVVAKTGLAFKQLARQFKERHVKKEYVALVWGRLQGDSGVIDRPIGRHRRDRKRMSSRYLLAKSRAAVTEWQLMKLFKVDIQSASVAWLSWLRLEPKTGRTHQLRVHLADLGFAIVGDKIYGHKKIEQARQSSTRSPVSTFPRQALHAAKLDFFHPTSGKLMVCSAPLPPDMRDLLSWLDENSAIVPPAAQ